MFPDDVTLLARGKYSTLNKMRREQLERVQGIVTTIVTDAHKVLRDCQRERNEAPKEPQHMTELSKCLENLHAARETIHTLCLGLQELEEDAWPK